MPLSLFLLLLTVTVQIPGVPVMFIHSRKYSIERMPEAFGAPKV